MAKDKLKQVKSFFLTLAFAISVLIVVVSIINVSRFGIVGKAFYRPVQVYGVVSPGLPDDTEISFKVGALEVASVGLKENSYGFDPKMYFKMDSPASSTKEGYAEGDIVTVYIEGIKVIELSYFEAWATKKDINIPASKRAEIATKAAMASIQRACIPSWQCDLWNECADSIQLRVCRDTRHCGTDSARPAEVRSCTMPPSVDQPFPDRGTPWEILILVLFLFLVLGFFVSVFRRAKEAAHPKKKR